MEQVRTLWGDQEWLSVVLDRPVTIRRLDDRRWQCVIGEPGDEAEHLVEAVSGVQDNSVRWRVEEGPMAHEGHLELRVAPGDRGTELRVDLSYPEGRAGHRIRELRGNDPDQVLRSALRRAKSMIESGQVLSTMDEPSGRGPVAERTTRFMREKLATGGRS
ncbi:cyclase [Micromonospora sp. NPDC004704]